MPKKESEKIVPITRGLSDGGRDQRKQDAWQQFSESYIFLLKNADNISSHEKLERAIPAAEALVRYMDSLAESRRPTLGSTKRDVAEITFRFAFWAATQIPMASDERMRSFFGALTAALSKLEFKGSASVTPSSLEEIRAEAESLAQGVPATLKGVHWVDRDKVTRLAQLYKGVMESLSKLLSEDADGVPSK